MKRQHNEKHLKFIRQLPCVVCGDNTTTEAAHIRHHDERAAKRHVGLGEKPDDAWTVPLCGACHRRQHTMNEREFWRGVKVDATFVSLALWNASGDMERGEIIINANRKA